MADPTPPSDIPDPASPTPASPAPTPGPKRIRSMPDRPGSNRPAGSVRSAVEQAPPGTARMSDSYAETLRNEESWKRGLAILWALFVVVMILDLRNAECYCLAGKLGWPLPVEVARIGLFCTAFIALWSGLGLTRYLLVLVSFLAGAWLWTDSTLSYRAYPQLMATGSADWTVYSYAEALPKVAAGLFCIVIAAYVLFSYDIREFVAHRRQRGRIWSALLSVIVAYGLMLAVFAVPLFYGQWMQARYAEVQQFGDETLRTAAEHWEPTAFDAVLDPGYAKTGFTKADRATTFGNFKALGPVKNIDPAPVVARPPTPQYPLQDKYPIPQGINSQSDAKLTGFELIAKYGPVNVDFEHGHGRFGFDLARPLSGRWRITKLNVESVQYDRPAAPVPTPVPAAAPASMDGAAPVTPAGTPAVTVAPTPAASVAPAPSATP